MNFLFWFGIAIRVLAQISTAAANPDAASNEQSLSSSQDELLHWLRQCGGYWNPKQSLRHENINDTSSLFGVFANDSIPKGQILASIPWECILHATPYPTNARFENCNTVNQLVKEFYKLDNNNFNNKNNDDSSDESSTDFSLYVQNLRKTAQEHSKLLPTNWSPQGKQLFLEITGHGILPPEDPFFDNFDWKHTCEDQQSQQHSEEEEEAVDDKNQDYYKMATLLVMTHGEDFGFVPLTDKYNNRGGNWTGAYFSHEGDYDNSDIGLEIRTLRYINAGEQIYTDYRDYGPIGTPELIRDYGFVEHYPQRWIFSKQHIAFDIDYNSDEVLYVKWWRKHQSSSSQQQTCPTSDDEYDALIFLQEQWKRLKFEVSPKMEQARINHDIIPRHEFHTMNQFFHDMMTAIKLALDDGALDSCRQQQATSR